MLKYQRRWVWMGAVVIVGNDCLPALAADEALGVVGAAQG